VTAVKPELRIPIARTGNDNNSQGKINFKPRKTTKQGMRALLLKKPVSYGPRKPASTKVQTGINRGGTVWKHPLWDNQTTCELEERFKAQPGEERKSNSTQRRG
jgi:hypothetical protein